MTPSLGAAGDGEVTRAIYDLLMGRFADARGSALWDAIFAHVAHVPHVGATPAVPDGAHCKHGRSVCEPCIAEAIIAEDSAAVPEGGSPAPMCPCGARKSAVDALYHCPQCDLAAVSPVETTGEPRTITLGGIKLRFVDGQLQRQFSGGAGWHPALYTSVRPDDAEAYAEFCRQYTSSPGGPLNIRAMSMAEAVARGIAIGPAGRTGEASASDVFSPDGAFANWFAVNYPCGATISDPLWHAPKVLQAARNALAISHPSPSESQVCGSGGCPCLLVTPCSPACSCANPLLSGGCARCARYGSPEQRLATAKRLAGESQISSGPPGVAELDALHREYRELVRSSPLQGADALNATDRVTLLDEQIVELQTELRDYEMLEDRLCGKDGQFETYISRLEKRLAESGADAGSEDTADLLALIAECEESAATRAVRFRDDAREDPELTISRIGAATRAEQEAESFRTIAEIVSRAARTLPRSSE